MSELEIIRWTLIALFIIAVTAVVVGWRFIKKYEKLKLEFTTNSLTEFKGMLSEFITDSSTKQDVHQNKISTQDEKFHESRLQVYNEFLKKMEYDYATHTAKVDELNQQYSKLNKEIESRNKEFAKINPQLFETIGLLRDQDTGIKELIERQFNQLTKAGEEYQSGFSNLFKNLNDDFTEKTNDLNETINNTHNLHNDKIKEYSSELCNEMVQLGKKLTKSQQDSLKDFKDNLTELSGNAELGLKKAVKEYSLNKLEEQVTKAGETHEKFFSEWNVKLQKIIVTQAQLSNNMEETKNILNIMKENKGIFKKLF